MSYADGRSADFALLLKPYWTMKATGAEHGTSYQYDTHVPILLMGKGVLPGEYVSPVAPTDVAPTLAFLAGVTLPRPYGRVLTEALTRVAVSVPPKIPSGR